MAVSFDHACRAGVSGCQSSRVHPRAEQPLRRLPCNTATRLFHRTTRSVVFAMTAWLILLWPAPLHAQSVWELAPYRVRILIAASNAPALRQVPDQLVEELAPRLENLLGAAWQIDVASEGGLRQFPQHTAPTPGQPGASAAETGQSPRLPANIWQLPAEATDAALLPEEWLKADYDKVLLLRVDPAIDGWRVAAREWDAATWRLGPVLEYPVRQPAKLRDTAVRALLAAFRPLARIERVETGKGGQQATLRLRAGGLPTRDSDLQLAHAGQLFCPIVRLNDREGRLRRDREGNRMLPQPVPWTFMVAEDVRGSEASCRVQSGLSAPLSASRRGRMEQLALRVVPRPGATRLTLLDRREPHEPIAGCEVFLQRPDETSTTLLGRTDRAGNVEISPADDPLVILLVRSGQQLLARLPMVAGFATELTAYLPDDTLRLEAEAFVTALQEQLVDAVTRRQVLLTRAEAQLDAGRAAEARELLAQLQRLPDREILRRRLVTRRSQLRSADPHVQRQIESLFSDTSKLLDSHLDPSPVEALSQAIARQASQNP